MGDVVVPVHVVKPKKKPPRQFWHKQYFILDVEMFRVQVGVAINLSEAEIRRRARGAKPAAYEEICEGIKDWDKENTTGTEGRLLTALGGFVVLLNLDKDDFRHGVGVLVHEMTHAVQYILRNRRVPLTEDTEEVHAYLVEHLVVAALRRMY